MKTDASQMKNIKYGVFVDQINCENIAYKQ